MSPHIQPSLDALLADPLIQTIMRADHVDPQALRDELKVIARRVAAGRASRRGGAAFARTNGDRRNAFRAANANPTMVGRAPTRIGCGGASLCC